MKKISLTQGQYAVVDDEDFVWLSKYKWFARYDKKGQRFYATRGVYNGKNMSCVWMHREILDTPKWVLTDHINHDTLDNRKKNLRCASHTENLRNARLRKDSKSGYKGVSKHGKKWRAYINVYGQRRCLGSYVDILSAARAYNKVALKMFGEFAQPNIV